MSVLAPCLSQLHFTLVGPSVLFSCGLQPLPEGMDECSQNERLCDSPEACSTLCLPRINHLHFRLMAGSLSSAGTSATPPQGHQLPPPRGSQLKQAVGGCWGRELLAAETASTSRMSTGRQVLLHCPLAHGLGCETMHVSKCDRAQRHATPGGILLGTLSE